MTPVPRDIPLPLPASAPFLEALLTIAFVCHLLFVNLMVGSTLLVLGFEVKGRGGDRTFVHLARTLAATVTVNKSLAVVMGVAPLLVINVIYTVHFYTANALTGTAWILLVPTIATAFLLLYIHKYTWDRWANRPARRIAILGTAASLLLFVPLVFLANVTLMMLPDEWSRVSGFWSTLTLPGVLPRYLHFINASIVLSSLFGVAYFGRRSAVLPTDFDARRARRALYSVALAASVAQYLVGPSILVVFPRDGLTVRSVTPIIIGAVASLPAMLLIARERRARTGSRRALWWIVVLLSVAVASMALGRHTMRLRLLGEHRAEIMRSTAAWQRDAREAARDARAAATGVHPGKKVFDETCAGCHGVDRTIVGPPLIEIAQIYQGNPEGIVSWATAPGKKRPEAPQMPPFASLGRERLSAVAAYILEEGGRAKR